MKHYERFLIGGTIVFVLIMLVGALYAIWSYIIEYPLVFLTVGVTAAGFYLLGYVGEKIMNWLDRWPFG